MASVNELVSRIKYRLSRQDDSSIDARILDELAFAQTELESSATLPWFLSTVASYNVTGAHDSFSILNFTGYLRTCEDDFGLRVENTTLSDETYVKLTKQDSYGQLLRYSSGFADSSVFPDSYCVLGTTVHIRKKQVVGRKYLLSYFKSDVPPAAGQENLWTKYAPGYIASEAGIAVAKYLRDNDGFKYFSAQREAKRIELFKRNQALQDADQSYVMDE